MDNFEIAGVIEKAADILESETVGWCQENYYTLGEHGEILSLCALGAVRAAIALDLGLSIEATMPSAGHGLHVQIADGEIEVSEALRMYMRGQVSVPENYELIDEEDGWEGIHEFNDIPDQTREEVVELMKTAAKDLRNESNE